VFEPLTYKNKDQFYKKLRALLDGYLWTLHRHALSNRGGYEWSDCHREIWSAQVIEQESDQHSGGCTIETPHYELFITYPDASFCFLETGNCLIIQQHTTTETLLTWTFLRDHKQGK